MLMKSSIITSAFLKYQVSYFCYFHIKLQITVICVSYFYFALALMGQPPNCYRDSAIKIPTKERCFLRICAETLAIRASENKYILLTSPFQLAREQYFCQAFHKPKRFRAVSFNASHVLILRPACTPHGHLYKNFIPTRAHGVIMLPRRQKLVRW